MTIHIWKTGAGAELTARELELIADNVRAFGRVTLLVPSFGERDAFRRQLAENGVGTGVDVLTPASWIASLWELFGNGYAIVNNLQRRMIMSAVIAGHAAEDLAPLRNNAGTVRMLGRMARELLPYATANDAPALAGEAERMVCQLLCEYRAALDARGLVEASDAAAMLAKAFEGHAPSCARCVVVRDVMTLPTYLCRLLAASEHVDVLLARHQETLADDISSAFGRLNCEAAEGELVGVGHLGSEACDSATPVRFLEIAGPHAKAAAYAAELERLLNEAGHSSSRLAAVSPRPAELFAELAPRLAAKGIASEVRASVRWSDTSAGQCFSTLSDLVSCMQEAGEDPLRAGEWWPAPGLTDWLYSPLSGMDASFARAFDKKIRSRRSFTPELVMRELQSVQGRQLAARKKLDQDHPFAAVPAVCADVFSFLWQGRPVSALKAMLSVAQALPASAFGSQGGQVRAQVECAVLSKAIETVGEVAHNLDVSQDVAAACLDELRESVPLASSPATGTPAGQVRFMTLSEAAELAAGAVESILFADVDVESYPLSHEEGPQATLAMELQTPVLALEPAARLRCLFSRALAVPCGTSVFARVTHDRQAKDRYPAAIWTELRAAVGEAATVQTVGEGDIVGDLDPCGAAHLRTERVECLPPQQVADDAVSYVVLKQRNPNDPSGALSPRRFSASQIESYISCPLCWFVSSRVRPQLIDAGFGNMEKGNFVHDVMERFHKGLKELGECRVTPQNLSAARQLLHETFRTVRAEHARGKTSTSGPLIPLSTLEDVQIDEILPQLDAVISYEAEALPPFAPQLAEFAFDGLGIMYAGRPLGGRIDRVDVDAEGRAVVIDYKHRSGVDPFKLKDPTVPDKKTGEVPADDPDWLPEHTQSLIYAQALRRTNPALDTRAALYFSTKSMRPAMRGAVADELLDMVPGLKDGFPAPDGTMDFDTLLDRVEDVISRRLDSMEAGNIAASGTRKTSCGYNHALGFERRDA